MQIDVHRQLLIRKIRKQMDFICGKCDEPEEKMIRNVEQSLLDMEMALKPCRIKQSMTADGETIFRTRHIGQYAMFLWFLSRNYYQEGNIEFAEDISYANSVLNSLFLNYKVNMPPHFYFDHPIGTIIGQAHIGDYFFCSQNCTVGAVTKGKELIWPHLGEHNEMMMGSSVIGDCHIGDYVIFASNCHVKNRCIPDNCIVFGQDRDIVIKQYSREEIKRHLVCF